jgi:hypothetical protein
VRGEREREVRAKAGQDVTRLFVHAVTKNALYECMMLSEICRTGYVSTSQAARNLCLSDSSMSQWHTAPTAGCWATHLHSTCQRPATQSLQAHISRHTHVNRLPCVTSAVE